MAFAGRLGAAGAACPSSLSSVTEAVDDFVAKPCLPDELLVKVRALLDVR